MASCCVQSLADAVATLIQFYKILHSEGPLKEPGVEADLEHGGSTNIAGSEF